MADLSKETLSSPVLASRLDGRAKDATGRTRDPPQCSHAFSSFTPVSGKTTAVEGAEKGVLGECRLDCTISFVFFLTCTLPSKSLRRAGLHRQHRVLFSLTEYNKNSNVDVYKCVPCTLSLIWGRSEETVAACN